MQSNDVVIAKKYYKNEKVENKYCFAMNNKT